MEKQLNEDEERRLSPAAALSAAALRRFPDDRQGHRQAFAADADRILHSRAYTRYIDKTQVFCLIANDHITHRVLHVQLVSRIARTIGRYLHLNEDLIEAISLGHDIGHPPFGHDGEHFLSTLCTAHGLPPFQHNIQSVRFLDQLERQGRGWNLTLQTLDGILCHDGELHARPMSPEPITTFEAFDRKLAAKRDNPALNLTPATLEGCVMRLADTIAYIGRDIEDAITLGLIRRDDIPDSCRMLLGDTNGSIVYALVTDLIAHSQVIPPREKCPGLPPKPCRAAAPEISTEVDTPSAQPPSGHIGFSEQIGAALKELKEFNYRHIYLNPRAKVHMSLVRNCYEALFSFYLDCLAGAPVGPGEPCALIRSTLATHPDRDIPTVVVRDYIAGMTDDFFLRQAAAIGCVIPAKQ